MGRWVYREGKKGPISSYFRSYFFACLIFNFIGLIGCMSVKYFDSDGEITKAKWKGAFAGLAFSVAGFAWMIVVTSISDNKFLIAIGAFILLAGFIFGICYKYQPHKKTQSQHLSLTRNNNVEEMTRWVEAYLRNIGMSQIAISAAVSDGKLSASYNLIREKPSISKEDFLIAMEMYEFL